MRIRFPADGFQYFSIMRGWVFIDDFFPREFRERLLNNRKLIYFELLIFGRMGVVKGPLLQRYIFADKDYQPAILLIKILD